MVDKAGQSQLRGWFQVRLAREHLSVLHKVPQQWLYYCYLIFHNMLQKSNDDPLSEPGHLRRISPQPISTGLQVARYGVTQL